MAARSLRDWSLLFALVAFWGSNFVLVKIALGAVPPATLVAARLIIGAVILVTVIRALGYTFPSFGRAWTPYVVLAMLGNCLPFWFISWGQQHIDSALAGILIAVMPLVTLLLAHRFVSGERMTLSRAGGFLLGLAGMLVLMGPAALTGLGGVMIEILAQLSVLAGAFCYATNSVYARVALRGDVMLASAASIAIAALISLPVALIVDQPWRLAPGWEIVTLIVWIGVGPTAIATIIYFKLIGSAGPTFMSLVNYLTPCVALVLGMMLLQEEPGLNLYAGLALILAGIAVSQLRRQQA